MRLQCERLWSIYAGIAEQTVRVGKSVQLPQRFWRHFRPVSVNSPLGVNQDSCSAYTRNRSFASVICAFNERVVMTKACTLFLRGRTTASRPRLQLCRQQMLPWQVSRWTRNTSTGQTVTYPKALSKPLWTSGRVLLLTGFASALAYAFGVTDAGTHIDELWKKERDPKYGSVKDLEKVGSSP